MNEEKELYSKICMDCGFEFKTEQKRAKLCDICRKKKSVQNSKEQNKQFKKPKVNVRTVKDSIPIREYTAIIEQYNREHGTRYTYGQFTALVSVGEIKLGEYSDK